MKRRYLFPLIYIVANASSLLWAPEMSLIFLLSIPSNIVLRIPSMAFHLSIEPIYFDYLVGVGTILQMFLLGLGWERLVYHVSRVIDRKRVMV